MTRPSWFDDALAMRPDEGTSTVEGVDVHWLRWGPSDGPGLVLVHGGAAHAHWWSHLAPFFTPGYRVVAVDLSGHGDSGRREVYRSELWARELLTAAADAGVVGPPVVVGHSMGGFVTIVTAALYGEDLAGAIIVDSPVRRPDPESAEGQAGRDFTTRRSYPDLETALEHFRLVPEQPCDNDFVIDHVARHSLRRADDGTWTWKFDPGLFTRTRRKAALHQYLADVSTRVAVLHGQWSDIVTTDVTDYMNELLGRTAPFVEIPAAYHHLILDQPLAFVAAVRALLADWEHSIPTRVLKEQRLIGDATGP